MGQNREGKVDTPLQSTFYLPFLPEFCAAPLKILRDLRDRFLSFGDALFRYDLYDCMIYDGYLIFPSHLYHTTFSHFLSSFCCNQGRFLEGSWIWKDIWTGQIDLGLRHMRIRLAMAACM
jgi:hypothetical protein